MFHRLSRILSTRSSYAAVTTRICSQNAVFNRKTQYENQVELIKSIDDNNAHNQDWILVKNNVLSMRGNLTNKNIDAVMLKIIVGSKNLVAASLFAQHLKSTNEELSLGCINSILYMYSEMGKVKELTEEQKSFILDTYKSLYKKYKILDSSTCEQLIQVLCVMNEWEKALKVLADIHMSSVPSHLAYSCIIATLFRLNKKKKALELIQQSVSHKRPLLHLVYEEWINYILRKYKDKKIVMIHLEEILTHIGTNTAVITEKTANRFKELYSSLDWDAQFARIRKSDGQCSNCKDTLDCLSLSPEEFNVLQQNIKEKLIVGSDLLLKTTDDELKRFLDFVERTAPYDVVLDGLNIGYAVGYAPHSEKLRLLNHVVEHFEKQNKKILLLGRQHMMKWNTRMMERIMKKAYSFLTENVSQDDPFFITAAILSGPQTDIVSKDLLRGHKFNLKDDSLKQLFRRWQWQHQWMIYMSQQKGPVVQPPLKFTPCAQKKNNTWHIPFESETETAAPAVRNDGTPDLRSWLCLSQFKAKAVNKVINKLYHN